MHIAIRDDGRVAQCLQLPEGSRWDVPEGWTVIQSDFVFEHNCWEYVYEHGVFVYRPEPTSPEITVDDLSEAISEVAALTAANEATLDDVVMAVVELAEIIGGEKDG